MKNDKEFLKQGLELSKVKFDYLTHLQQCKKMHDQNEKLFKMLKYRAKTAEDKLSIQEAKVKRLEAKVKELRAEIDLGTRR